MSTPTSKPPVRCVAFRSRPQSSRLLGLNLTPTSQMQTELSTRYFRCSVTLPNADRCFECSILIYHSDFLKRTLPSDHLLFKNPIFMGEARLARLREEIIAPRSDAPSATGISPHTLIIKGIDDIANKERMSGSPSCQSGDGTTQRMYDVMKDMLDNMHETIKALHPADGASGVETANNAVETTPIGPLFPLFEWSDGLGLRCLPQDYQLQGAITMRDALRLWYLSAGIAKGAALPPLCKMRSIDLHSRHYRKNYCLLKANINTFICCQQRVFRGAN